MDVQTNTFRGIGTGERIVISPGSDTGPTVSIDTHDEKNVIPVELSNAEAIRLAHGLIGAAQGTPDDMDNSMVTAIARISKAAEQAREVHLSNLADLLESFLIFPVMKPETLPILLTLTGAISND